MKKLLMILFAFSYILSAQVESSSGVSQFSQAQIFYVDFVNYIDTMPNKTRLDVFIQVPYSNIQFVKSNNNFNASYNITLIFYDKDKKNILFERIWKEKVTTAKFEQTLSKKNFNLSYRTFDFYPGDYFLTCILEDSDSRKSFSMDFPLRINSITDSLGLSDILLIMDIIKDSTSEKIVPNVAKTVTNKTKSLPFYFEVYSSKDRDVYFEYIIENLKTNTSIKQLIPYQLKAGTNSIYYTFENTEFRLGDYKLTVNLEDSENRTLASVDKKIYSIITGLPASIVDLDLAIEQMLYIASPNELSFIKNGETYDERLNRFLAFWEKKKPNSKTDENPIMNEYYRRVEYANKNFKGWGREGWRSDMGMIYITFGPPSYVERHPLEPNSRPYEIWDYYELNRSFIFVDQTGFGDYRLLNPDYSRWPGYRP